MKLASTWINGVFANVRIVAPYVLFDAFRNAIRFDSRVWVAAGSRARGDLEVAASSRPSQPSKAEALRKRSNPSSERNI